MDGLILVRKPVPWTSHDVVRSLRRTLGEKRVGHFGTLDPLASGLLLTAIGKATRLFPYFSVYEKTYEARIRLGFATDTYDAEGRPLGEERTDLPPLEVLTAALGRFEGEIEQLPPPYSAKKIDGKPLYAYARKKQEVERRPSRVFVRAFRLRGYEPPFFDAEVVCASGTYVRGLAHDLGLALGCGAHLSGLVRTAIGPFRLADGHDPDEIRALRDEGRTGLFLLPLQDLLTDRPGYVLSGGEAEDVRQGRSVRPKNSPIAPAGPEPVSNPPIVRLLGPSGDLAALARPGGEPGVWAPVLVFL